MADLQETVELRKIDIEIHDKSRNRTTGELENVIVQIERDLYLKEDSEEDQVYATITPNGGYHEHNVLLYIEHFGTEVFGTLEYVTEKDKKEGTTSKMDINKFHLELIKGQKLVKNHTFKDFWQKAEEYEAMRNQGDGTIDF